MKTVVRKKTIKGIEYLYEITYYYDPESKRTRQHSRYLGKAVDGKPVKVRDISRAPKMALSYGELLPFLAAGDEYRLEERLRASLSPEEARAVLILAYNRVVRPLAIVHIGSWYKGTVLSRKYPDLPLSSQYLSTLLAKVGEDRVTYRFFCDLIGDLSTDRTLLYDITSISSYSSLISLFEYGHNRDHLDLPQVNLSLAVDRERGIPVYYDLYPGSIVDVSTLRGTVAKLESLPVKECTLILDRGFCSTANLALLTEHRIPFVMPAARTFKAVKEAMSRLHPTIGSSRNIHRFHGRTIFVTPVTLTIEEMPLSGYGYYSPSREQEDREQFYQRLQDTVERLESLRIPSYLNPQRVFEEYAGPLRQYLSWEVRNRRFVVTTREKAVSQYVNTRGLFILLYRGDLTWEECLALYRSRELVERSFDVLKNDLAVMPLHIRTRESLCGPLFISFLSLLLRMHLLREIQRRGVLKKCSMERVLMELEKIRWIEFPDGKFLITEIGKTARKTLDSLEIAPAVKNYVTS